ncbi:MAG: deoxynucleoside kinase [Nitrospinota bacterium]
MRRARYIAIEGPLGVGKTSLARLLSRRIPARLLLEPIGENPFLPAFYEDPAGIALKVQLFFLLLRHRQQMALRREMKRAGAIVSDYLFAKDRIFARTNLKGAELRIYEEVASLLEPPPRPDLLLFLRAPTELLMERIRKRDRSYERGIDPGYVGRLNRAYGRFFSGYRESPLLVVRADRIDLLSQKGAVEKLLLRIEEPWQGRRYFP